MGAPSTMPRPTGLRPRVAARTRATRLPSRAPLGATHREVSLLEGPGRVRAPLGEQVSLSKYRAERHADRLKRRAARAAARGLGLAAIGIVYGAPTLLHCVDGQCG